MEKVVENKGFNRRPPCLGAFVYESDNNVVSQKIGGETQVTNKL